MKPQDLARKQADKFSKTYSNTANNPLLATGGDNRMTSEAVNTGAIARMRGSQQKLPVPNANPVSAPSVPQNYIDHLYRTRQNADSPVTSYNAAMESAQQLGQHPIWNDMDQPNLENWWNNKMRSLGAGASQGARGIQKFINPRVPQSTFKNQY